MSESNVMGLGAFLRIFFRKLKPYRAKAILLFLLLGVDVGFKTAWPLSFKFLIDHGLTDRNQRVLVNTLLFLAAAVVVSSVGALVRDYLYAFLSARIAHDTRVRIFRHLQELAVGFYARHRTGDIMARFTTDLSALENSVSWVTASLTLNSLNVLLSAMILVTLEWRLAAITVIGLVLCAAVPRSLSNRAARAAYEKKKWEGDLASYVQENVTSQAVVKAFGLQQRAAGKFLTQSEDCAALSKRFYFLANLVERTPNTIILMTEVVAMGVGVLLVFHDQLTLGTVVAFHALFLNLSSSVEGLTAVLPILLQSLGGVQRVEELLAEPSGEALETPGEAAQVLAFTSALTLHNTSFSYTGEQRILNGVDLEIPRGAFVALVGGSGSGKSTVLNLLLRFYDCQGGTVLMDGRDVRSIPRSALRGHMGVVFQENFLFNLSLRENIRLGRPEASDAEVEAAARAAEIHDAIQQMPQGYETLAGERGGSLSGGQRQRVAIARALLRDPAILILDEATSALDPATEEAINGTIQRAGRGRTVVSVTHRLASVTAADRIYVFQSGRVTESGRHAELLARNGDYAALWKKQSGFSLRDNGDLAEIRAEGLRRYPILRELDDSTLENLACLFVTEVYGPDRRVVREGDPGDRFYIIVRGRVNVVRARAGEADEVVSVLEDGDYFGEVALLDDVPRTATVTTIGSCVFLSLQRQQFKLLLAQAPRVLELLKRGRVRPATA